MNLNNELLYYNFQPFSNLPNFSKKNRVIVLNTLLPPGSDSTGLNVCQQYLNEHNGEYC